MYAELLLKNQELGPAHLCSSPVPVIASTQQPSSRTLVF